MAAHTGPRARDGHGHSDTHVADQLLPAFVALVKAVELVPSDTAAWNLLGLIAEVGPAVSHGRARNAPNSNARRADVERFMDAQWLELGPQAVTALERALAALPATADSATVLAVRGNLARALVATGRFADAHAHYAAIAPAMDVGGAPGVDARHELALRSTDGVAEFLAGNHAAAYAQFEQGACGVLCCLFKKKRDAGRA